MNKHDPIPLTGSDETPEGMPAEGVDLNPILRKAAIYFVGSFLILGIAVAAVSVMADGRKALSALTQLPLSLVLSVIGLALVNYAFRAARFRYYVACLGQPTGAVEMFIYYVSGFAMSMSPGKLGEMVRLWFLRKQYGFKYFKGVAAQIADRGNDVMVTALLCLAGIGMFAEHRWAVFGLVAIVAALFAILLRPQRLHDLIGLAYRLSGKRHPRLFVRLRHTIDNTAFMFRGDVLLKGSLLGIAGWLAECLALFLILKVLGAPITFLAAVFIFSFSNLAGGLTMLPGGLGGVEVSMFALLTLSNVPPDIATAATIVVRLCTLWFGVALGFGTILIAMRMAGIRDGGLSDAERQTKPGV